jgi:7-cyano-7-deazaguanine synthase in queuosine biosynthesis
VTDDRWYPGPAVCVDLDGTLIYDDHPAFGATRPGMAELCAALRRDGAWLIVASARPPTDQHRVTGMLAARGIEVDMVVCGVKPPADVYIDDRGLLHTPSVLHALVEWRLQGTARWLDGLDTSTSDFARNVAAHGQGGTDDRFLVTVPVTGGMDSLTLWAMAREAGVPYELVYLQMGQEYAAAEQRAIAELIDDPVVVIETGAQLTPLGDSWVLPGRNVRIMVLLAESMRGRGCWGEIWFGNTNGESPTVGGDKSRRFTNDMQHLLSCNGFDVTVCSPLVGLDKTDLVRWWQARGQVDRLAATKSCFHPTLRACGRCTACFRKLVAFRAAGQPMEWCSDMFNQPIDFAEQVRYYRTRMADGRWQSFGYSPARRAATLKVIEELM